MIKNKNYSILIGCLSVVFLLILQSCETKEDIQSLIDARETLQSDINNRQIQIHKLNKKINTLDSSKNNNNKLLVSSITAQKKAFEHYFEIQSQVVSKKNILLVPETGGLVENMHVKEGEFVQENQLIATFSSTLINSSIGELDEQLNLAEFIFNKQKNLADQGLGTEISLKEAKAKYNALLKSKQSLLTQKNKLSVYAPFSGYIDKVFISIGQLGGPSTPIVRLVNLDALYVVADVSENYLSRINVGQKANVLIPAININLENLKITRIGNQINSTNRTVVVETLISSRNKKIIPNLMTIMSVCDYLDTNAIVVPTRVILMNTKGHHLVKLINEKNEVVIRPVVVGMQYENETQIIEGLKPGDVVIDEGKGSVVEGQVVSSTLNN